jgi:LmbE family N-acetylglucosaminyl deacetylase
MQKINSILQMGIKNTDRLLIVMPHPDDEAVFTSGFIYQAISLHIPIRTIVITCGEKSSLTFGLHKNELLCDKRKKEQEHAFKILQLSNFNIYSIPDGEIENNSNKILQILKKEITQFKPTMLCTLEPDGIYGHPDHIALSQYCTRFKTKSIRILYTTVKPNFVFPKARWMSKKKELHPIDAQYELHLSISQIIIKFLTLCAHRSQFNYFLRWDPIKQFTINKIFFKEYFAFYQ